MSVRKKRDPDGGGAYRIKASERRSIGFDRLLRSLHTTSGPEFDICR